MISDCRSIIGLAENAPQSGQEIRKGWESRIIVAIHP